MSAVNFPVQDVSISEDHQIVGVRGGRVADHVLRRDIAARIFTADLLIAPARVGVTRSGWVFIPIQTGIQVDKLDSLTEYRRLDVNTLDAALRELPYQRV